MNPIEQAWKKLKDAPDAEKPDAFLEYCDVCVREKGKTLPREEEVAYKICGTTFMRELDSYPEIEKVIDFACDMEIPRESRVGAGLRGDEEWIEQNANTYKEKQYAELLKLIDGAKSLKRHKEK